MKKIKIFPKMFIQIFSVLAIIIILCVLVVRAFIQIGKRFNRKNVSKDVAEYNKQRLF